MAKFQEDISLDLDGRSLSLAGNDRHWLVVKADSGISVIDKETLALKSYLGISGTNSVDTFGNYAIIKSHSNGLYVASIDASTGAVCCFQILS